MPCWGLSREMVSSFPLGKDWLLNSIPSLRNADIWSHFLKTNFRELQGFPYQSLFRQPRSNHNFFLIIRKAKEGTSRAQAWSCLKIKGLSWKSRAALCPAVISVWKMRNNEINFIYMGQVLTPAISQLSWVQRKQAFLIVPTSSAFPQMRHPLSWLTPRPRPTTSSQKAQPCQFRWDPLVTITCRNAITELIPEFTLNFSHLQLILFGCWGWAELCWGDEQVANEA